MQINRNSTKNIKKSPFSFFVFQYTTDLSELKEQYFSVLYSYILSRFQDVVTSEFTITCTVRHLFYIPYKVRVHCEQNNEQAQCSFRVESENFIAISVFVILCAALFSYTSFSFFMWFSAIFLVVFYLVHYMFFSSLCARIYNQIRVRETADDFLSKEQLAWFKNPNVCPACGSEITKYHSYCPSCGLFLSKKTFSSLSATEQSVNITYTYVEFSNETEIKK